MKWLLYHYEMSLFASSNTLCLKFFFFFYINIATSAFLNFLFT